MATSPDYPPYEFIDLTKTGQESYVGSDIELEFVDSGSGNLYTLTTDPNTKDLLLHADSQGKTLAEQTEEPAPPGGVETPPAGEGMEAVQQVAAKHGLTLVDAQTAESMRNAAARLQQLVQRGLALSVTGSDGQPRWLATAAGRAQARSRA